MTVTIEMPKLSDTMSVGTVVKWHKNIGDKVQNGDTLAEIETDKATMELENFEDGIFSKFCKEGEAPIGSLPSLERKAKALTTKPLMLLTLKILNQVRVSSQDETFSDQKQQEIKMIFPLSKKLHTHKIPQQKIWLKKILFISSDRT